MRPMPTYEYACTACGERTEAKQSFSDPPLEICPHCGGKLRKLYSPVGVVFKGSGFYSTDAKKKASAGDKAASSSAEKPSGDSGKEPDKGSDKGSGQDSGTKTDGKASPAPASSGEKSA